MEQQIGPTRIAFEIALDKERLRELSDAKPLVNSTFTCPLLESQTSMRFTAASVYTLSLWQGAMSFCGFVFS